MNGSPTCVDLFAGCGGLSLGLKQAGFEIKLAVEKSAMAAETYYHNLVEPIEDAESWRQFCGQLTVEEQAKQGLVVGELLDVLNSSEIITGLRDIEIDLVVGGPPCQGFSMAGRRNPKDKRNELPWQFLDFVEAVRPKAVIMENVSGMRQDFRKHGTESRFDDLRIALENVAPGYMVQPLALNAKHFGVPQHRPRVFLIGLRKDIAVRLNANFSCEIWDSEFDGPHVQDLRNRPLLAPARTHFEAVGPFRYLTVQDAISDLDNEGYLDTSTLSSYAMEMRSEAMREIADKGSSKQKKKQSPPNHVLRQHSELVRARFSFYQHLRKAKIHPSVLSIPKKLELSESVRHSMIVDALAGMDAPIALADGRTIPARKKDLIRLVEEFATKKHSQRALSLGLPSPTILSLPDDLVHPTEPRTLTVREMARFQSFPDAFEFRSKETTGAHRRRFEVPQYTQVGNAVPPKLAKAIGLQLLSALRKSKEHCGSISKTSAVA